MRWPELRDRLLIITNDTPLCVAITG